LSNEIELPDGFEDINKRVRLTMARRASFYIDEDGEHQRLDWSEQGKNKAKDYILDHVVFYKGQYLTCFADNRPILDNDPQTTVDLCALSTNALSRTEISILLNLAPYSFQRYQYCPGFPRFLKVDGATTYNTWHPLDRLNVTDTMFKGWLNSQGMAKAEVGEWEKAGHKIDSQTIYQIYRSFSEPIVWKVMMKMLFGNQYSEVASDSWYEDQVIFAMWFACCVHRPLERVRWAPVIRGSHGIGKGTFQYLAKAVMGAGSISVVNNLKGITSQFAGERALTRLLVVDECYSKGDVAMEAFKPFVTDDIIPVERKGEQLFTTRATHNTIIFSNHYKPFKSAETERRWWVPPYREYDFKSGTKKERQAFHAEGNEQIRKALPLNGKGDQSQLVDLLCWLKLIAMATPDSFFSIAPQSDGFLDLLDLSAEESDAHLLSWLDGLGKDQALSLAQVVTAADVPQSKLTEQLRDLGFRDAQMTRGEYKGKKVWTKAPAGQGPTTVATYKPPEY